MICFSGLTERAFQKFFKPFRLESNSLDCGEEVRLSHVMINYTNIKFQPLKNHGLSFQILWFSKNQKIFLVTFLKVYRQIKNFITLVFSFKGVTIYHQHLANSYFIYNQNSLILDHFLSANEDKKYTAVFRAKFQRFFNAMFQFRSGYRCFQAR